MCCISCWHGYPLQFNSCPKQVPGEPLEGQSSNNRVASYLKYWKPMATNFWYYCQKPSSSIKQDTSCNYKNPYMIQLMDGGKRPVSMEAPNVPHSKGNTHAFEDLIDFNRPILDAMAGQEQCQLTIVGWINHCWLDQSQCADSILKLKIESFWFNS